MLEVASYSDDSIFGQKLTETYHYYGCADSYGPEYEIVATFCVGFTNTAYLVFFASKVRLRSYV